MHGLDCFSYLFRSCNLSRLWCSGPLLHDLRYGPFCSETNIGDEDCMYRRWSLYCMDAYAGVIAWFLAENGKLGAKCSSAESCCATDHGESIDMLCTSETVSHCEVSSDGLSCFGSTLDDIGAFNTHVIACCRSNPCRLLSASVHSIGDGMF